MKKIVIVEINNNSGAFGFKRFDNIEKANIFIKKINKTKILRAFIKI